MVRDREDAPVWENNIDKGKIRKTRELNAHETRLETLAMEGETLELRNERKRRILSPGKLSSRRFECLTGYKQAADVYANSRFDGYD